MSRFLSWTLAPLLLASLALAAPQTAPKPQALRCTLTGKKIETCCCEKRGEKFYCTLAKKTVDKCCCVAAASQAKKK